MSEHVQVSGCPGPLMHRIAFLAILILLAGCAGPAPLPIEPSPPVLVERLPIDEQIYFAEKPGCQVVRCTLEVPPRLVLQAPDDGSIVGLRINIGNASGVDGPVEWKLSCMAIVPSDEDGCHRALARGRDVLPKQVDVTGIQLPPGAEILLSLVVPQDGVPLVFGLLRDPSHVTGTAEFIRVEGAESLTVQVVDVSFDGHAGPCTVEEKDCPKSPGGSEFSIDSLDGTVIRANLTMTWISTSDLDQELTLRLSAYCGSTCPRAVLQNGTSPLALEAGGLRFRDELRIAVSDDEPDATGYNVLEFVGTRTPVHIEGTLLVVPTA
jgi:hypothetical protein